MTLFDLYREQYAKSSDEEMSLPEYFELCKKDPLAYATAAERMLAAIGEPEIIDTRNDSRLSRLFSNRMIKRYPAFKEFYGMDEAIAQIVAYFKHAAQGLEERKQVLYLLGPVGGGKSSIAERLKSLMETHPIYALKGSPVNESPLGLFSAERDGPALEKEYGIPARYLNGIMSPWAVKRLKEFDGDISKFRVVRVQPSVLRQVAITKTEPGDENNQDISSLVGKVDIRKLESLFAGRPGRLQLFGRPVPRQPGAARIRRDVQGADQDAAPAADRHAGRQLQGHRGLFARSRSTASSSPTPTSRNGKAFRNNKNNEALPRPHLHRQGAVLPARVRRGQHLREAAAQQLAVAARRARRARSR